MRVQPNVVGRGGADETVVLQIVAPRQNFEPVLFKTAEGVFGRSLFAPFLGLFQKPRKLQLFFEAPEIVHSVGGGDGGEQAQRIVELRLHFRLLRGERFERALLLAVALEIRLRVVGGGEPLVKDDLYGAAFFVVVVFKLAGAHPLL